MSPPISLGVTDTACHDGADYEGVQKATTPRALESPRKQYSISSALLKSNAKHRLFRAKALIESGVRTSDSYRESRSITNLINSTTNISRTAQADYDDSLVVGVVVVVVVVGDLHWVLPKQLALASRHVSASMSVC